MPIADDLEFIVKATITEFPRTQSVVYRVEQPSVENHMSLSVSMCGALNFQFYIRFGNPMKSMEE